MIIRRRWLHLAASLLLSTALAGCAANSLRQARTADELRDYDVAVASYLKALREHPDNQEAQLGLQRAQLRAAAAHLAAGRRLHSQGRDEDALTELQIASEFNPADSGIAEELRIVRQARREELSRPDGETALQSLIERSRSFQPAGYALPDVKLPAQITTGQQGTVRTVFMMLARLGNLSITFDTQFRDTPAQVSLLSGMSLAQALDAVARSSNTFYQVIGPSAVVVVPDTPAKRREYTNEVLRQFTIQNADLKETIDALRVVGDIRYIAPISGTNQILVRDSPERLQAVAEFIRQFDKARPEVVVDVEVFEVNRNRMREYGLQLASPGSTGIDGSADVNREGGLTLQTVRNLSQADVLMTNIPALYYRLLKTDTDTRTLANPHIRITDGTAATAKFGQDVPVPRLTITPIAQGGANIQPQTQFDYRTIGVNIGITPRTHANDEVTLALTIELSSIGAPGFDGLPTFGQRNVTTSIRLKDGETNILAGLIRQDERSEHQSIPGLGDVPILGSLFARNSKDAEQTDVVIMLTPHIIRSLSMTEDDMRPLRLPREGAAGPSIIEPIFQPTPIFPTPRDTNPANQPPANQPGQQPGTQPAPAQPGQSPTPPAPSPSQLPPGAGAPTGG
jgi:general secretion pathway protein D